jgi:phosphatidylglycerol:prolipoprotein diacylglycerol transferase
MYPALPLGIPSYGLMIFLAFVAGYFAALFLARKHGVSTKHIDNLMLLIVLCAPVGAKLWSVACNGWGTDWRYGYSSYGGVTACFLCLWVYVKYQKLSIRRLLDVLTPPFLLAFGMARVGCFLGGCCFGDTTTLPWGITLSGELPRHPAQIYEAFLAFALFLICLRVTAPRKKPSLAFFGAACILGAYRLLAASY